jgi:hypothetical protein
LTQSEEFAKLVDPLFYRIAQCLMSQHFQVRDTAETRGDCERNRKRA